MDFALDEEGLTTVAALEFAALPAMVWMEATGAPLDVAAWTKLRDEAAETLVTLDAELATALPGVNVDSSTQLPKALAELGVRVPNVQEATLRAAADQHPVVDLILRRKDVKKRVSTYGDGYLAHVHPATGRIHADYRAIGAASGRMSCSKPNLQNIPRDPAYRRCVRPAPGRVLIKADYSQIELRIAAQVSGDTAMQEAFRTGEDLHTKTARAVLGREPSKQDRQLAKALNFGLLYGMGATKLRTYAETDYGVSLTSGDATRFRNQFFRTYPGIQAWHRSHQSDESMTTRTLAGRLRKDVAFYAEQLASPISGTGVDILKLALARLWNDRETVPSAALALVVHDEIVVEVDAEDAERAAAWLTEHMQAAGAELLTDVPVEVEAAIIADWSGTPVGVQA
jgi:DNA polymerase-1